MSKFKDAVATATPAMMGWRPVAEIKDQPSINTPCPHYHDRYEGAKACAQAFIDFSNLPKRGAI